MCIMESLQFKTKGKVEVSLLKAPAQAQVVLQLPGPPGNLPPAHARDTCGPHTKENISAIAFENVAQHICTSITQRTLQEAGALRDVI